ncbi:MAG: shikimate dehydrogenase [Syntrophomonadaceae bacterium]|nr:shikimate dehydrogenase [Syntrophomonadaceae bacterium]
MITGNTRILGVMGYPVAHSFSPVMYNAAFAHSGLDWVYLAFSVPPGNLPEALAGLRALGMTGANLTIPHKEAALKHLDYLTPEADLIGAVNVLRIENDLLIGHNTDGTGFLQSLSREANFIPQQKKVLILGAGGAARAVALTLARRGALEIVIANRTQQRGVELALEVQKKTGVKAEGISLEPEALAAAVQTADLVVQASSVGMYPQSEAPDWFKPEWLSPSTLVCDLIYRPRPTRFLQLADQRGCLTLDGLGMLLYQGVQSFTWWTGLTAPVEIMRQALERWVPD